MNTLAIARLTFLEARQRKLLWAGVLMGVAFLLIFSIGFYFIHQDIERNVGPTMTEMMAPNNFFLMAGLYVVNFLVVVLAVLISVDTIAGEVASGTIHTLVTKPLRRWEVVMGKWLGLAVMLSLFTLLLAAAMIGVVWAIARYVPNNVLQGLALIVLEGIVVLSLSILGSARLSTLTNGVVIFMFYGLAFIAGWVEQFGALMRNSTATDIGILISFLMPSEAMWKRAAYLMQPPLMRDLGITPFSSASSPSSAMVMYTLGYTIVVLALAVRAFQRRDL